MDLHTNVSKPIIIISLTLAAIIILAIGVSIGSGFGHHRAYNNRMDCGYNSRLDNYRGHKFNGKQFRMMPPQTYNDNQGGQVQDKKAQVLEHQTKPLNLPTATATTTIK